jgi:tetratricopeptide (TPR) repeat protein
LGPEGQFEEIVMASAAACPGREDLRLLALGLLSERAAESVAGHVEQCAACLAVLRNLQVEDPLLVALAQPTSVAPPQDNHEVQTLIDRLREVPVLRAAAASGNAPAGPSAAGSDAPTLLGEAPVVAPAGSLVAFLAPPQGPDELGRLGPYRVLQVLGSGGMGVVFRAHDPHLDRPVALKALLPSYAVSPSAHERFLREARAAARLTHDHVVPIYHVGDDRGVPFLAMQLLEGESLEQRLRRRRVLPPAEVLRIGREAAEGLAAAHERGLVHRDIKPGNLWLETRASEPAIEGRVKILDFGLAQAAGAEPRLTMPGAVVGTPGFMAPEQASGQDVDGRCDLFSLGCVLYLMAAGRPPFRGSDPISTFLAAATEDPPPPAQVNPAVPAAVSDLIITLLAKSPGDRPASARAAVQMIRDIENGLTEELAPRRPAAVRPAPAARPRAAARTPVKRRWHIMAGGGALLLGAIATFAVFHQMRSKDEPGETRPRPPETAQDHREKPTPAVVRTDPKAAQAHFRQGVALARKREYERAALEFTKTLWLDPEHAWAYANRGWAYHLMGKDRQAVSDLSEAIRLDPAAAGMYLSRAQVYGAQRRYAEAIADCDEVIRLEPRRAAAWNWRGYCRYQEKDYGRALSDLEQALRLNPNFPGAYNHRGLVYLARGQAEAAIADFGEAIRASPNFAHAYLNRGRAYLKQGKLDPALADLDEVIRRHPRLAPAYYYRSRVYTRKGDKSRAKTDLAAALRLDPGLASRLP